MNNQAYSTWLEIDLGAIRANIKTIQTMTNAAVMAVIKANGYGHGALTVAKAVTEAGASWCGVARIEEALHLREAGITSEIMVLGYTPPMLIPEAIQHRIHVAIYDPAMARAYAVQARRVDGQLKAHVKVETGMGRLGMRTEQVLPFLQDYAHHANLQVDGIFTHFARADESDNAMTTLQLKRFKAVLAELQKANLCPENIHTANSAAMINFPETHYNLVRPGIAIFGLSPSLNMVLPDGFRPALTWKARLTSVRTFPAGQGISYGSRYVTQQEERIGVIPVGYGDGYRRVRDQQVLVNGKRVDVVGQVCMDQCMLQLDSVPEAAAGDEVVLLGSQENGTISADDLADRWGTVNYEVICGLADRLPRLYFD